MNVVEQFGSLLNAQIGEREMPVITVEGPKIDLEKKRQLVKKLTDSAAEVYGNIPITVLVKENAPENVGVSGELLLDRRKKKD